MHDNASIHCLRYTREWLEDRGIFVLGGWPPYSPNLNPIEHLWCNQNIRDTLERILPKAWQRIKDEVIINRVKSMPRRLQAVIDAEG